MEPESIVTPYLILLGVLLIPALVFVVAFMVVRMRRSTFRHGRSHRRTRSAH
jgi:flagellar biogenesis protein FliO